MDFNEAEKTITGICIEAHGFPAGIEKARILSKPILLDFRKMLRHAYVGEIIEETYNSEDLKLSITITGQKAAGGLLIMSIEKEIHS